MCHLGRWHLTQDRCHLTLVIYQNYHQNTCRFLQIKCKLVWAPLYTDLLRNQSFPPPFLSSISVYSVHRQVGTWIAQRTAKTSRMSVQVKVTWVKVMQGLIFHQKCPMTKRCKMFHLWKAMQSKVKDITKVKVTDLNSDLPLYPPLLHHVISTRLLRAQIGEICLSVSELSTKTFRVQTMTRRLYLTGNLLRHNLSPPWGKNRKVTKAHGYVSTALITIKLGLMFVRYVPKPAPTPRFWSPRVGRRSALTQRSRGLHSQGAVPGHHSPSKRRAGSRGNLWTMRPVVRHGFCSWHLRQAKPCRKMLIRYLKTPFICQYYFCVNLRGWRDTQNNSLPLFSVARIIVPKKKEKKKESWFRNKFLVRSLLKLVEVPYMYIGNFLWGFNFRWVPNLPWNRQKQTQQKNKPCYTSSLIVLEIAKIELGENLTHLPSVIFAKKICYDKAGNLPNKGRNFNTQTWGKIVYFLFVWLVGIGFRQNFFRVLPNFGDFGAKMSFFHYIINQNRNNFIKHCSPPCTKKPLISEMCIYIKSSLCKWGLGTRGGNDVL